jgi:hypothetical protein
VAVEYEYDEEHNVLYTRFFGVVTDEDLRGQAQAVASDPRIRPGVRELVDLGGIEGIDASPSTFEYILLVDRVHARRYEGMRTAIVAPTELLYDYSRVYECMSGLRRSPATVRTFRSLREAEGWLGL